MKHRTSGYTRRADKHIQLTGLFWSMTMYGITTSCKCHALYSRTVYNVKDIKFVYSLPIPMTLYMFENARPGRLGGPGYFGLTPLKYV